ncbi:MULTISPECIES: hypothetical protein [Frankia]|uniref:hypothetical protein n=1 Tax=Frankia TaxID=1854 RepID=UPI0006EBE1C0|nr:MULTISPECIES: hypothetical protein [Frankia]
MLGDLIAAIEAQPLDAGTAHEDAMGARVDVLVEERLALLRDVLVATVHDLLPRLATRHADLLGREHRRWARTTGWMLINAADSRGS